jgi:predicted secreted protein
MKTFEPGESITVRVAEQFELRLSVLATAGYQWQIGEKAPGLTVLESHFEAPTDDRIGGASQQIFRLRADRPSKSTLRLICTQAGETTPTQTLNVPVTVRG